MIELTKLRLDGGTQPRAALDPATIDEYAEAYRAGAQFPPVIVFYDGEHYWLADGYHRVEAARLAGRTEIYEDITPGSKRDAILFSLSANARHGLKRSNVDKRRAVETLLADPEWSTWSSREIAKACAVSHTFVDDSRRASLATLPVSAPDERTVTTKHGTTTTMNVTNIGKTPEPPEPAPKAKPKLLSEEESARILAENARLQAECERRQEAAEAVAADAQATLDDNMRMSAIFEADDRLAAAMKEIERQAAEIRVLRSQLVGETNGKNEYIRLVKFWKRKAEKLEKAAGQGGAS